MKKIVLKKDHPGYSAHLKGEFPMRGKTRVEALGELLKVHHLSMGFQIEEWLPRGVMPQNGDSPMDGNALYQAITSSKPELFRDYWGEEILIHCPTGVWVLGDDITAADTLKEELASKHMSREEADIAGRDFFARSIGS